MVQSSGFRVVGSGLRAQGSGFRVPGSGFRVQGLGFRVSIDEVARSGVKHPESLARFALGTHP